MYGKKKWVSGMTKKEDLFRAETLEWFYKWLTRTFFMHIPSLGIKEHATRRDYLERNIPLLPHHYASNQKLLVSNKRGKVYAR